MSSIFLIIGGSGQVGGHLGNALTERGHKYITTHYSIAVNDSIFLDISNREDVLHEVEKIRPKVIYLPAALTNVDYCEQNPNESYKINVQGVENIVEATEHLKAQLVYFSTDYIFDGHSGPYSEEDVPNPLSIYGKQKFHAEQVITERVTNYIIIRTTVVYGWEQQGKNFVIRLIRALQNHQEVKVPVDQIGTPTYAPYLAQTSIQLTESGAQGIYNIAGKDLVSRYDFACEAADVFNCDKGLILPVNTDDLHQPAARPLNGGLKINKTAQMFKNLPLSCSESLKIMSESWLAPKSIIS